MIEQRFIATSIIDRGDDFERNNHVVQFFDTRRFGPKGTDVLNVVINSAVRTTPSVAGPNPIPVLSVCVCCSGVVTIKWRWRGRGLPVCGLAIAYY